MFYKGILTLNISKILRPAAGIDLSTAKVRIKRPAGNWVLEIGIRWEIA